MSENRLTTGWQKLPNLGEQEQPADRARIFPPSSQFEKSQVAKGGEDTGHQSTHWGGQFDPNP